MNNFRSLLACCLWILSTAALAHHSNTPYDMSKSLHATGVVKEANFKNPHSTMTLMMEVAGKTRAVNFEGHSLATLRHYGLTPSMVKIGDTISISYAPRRDKDEGGIFLSITTASGETHDFSHLGYEEKSEAK